MVVSERLAVSQRDVAAYVCDMSRELAEMARNAGLRQLALDLEVVRRTAGADLRALHSAAGKAAPEDAA